MNSRKCTSEVLVLFKTFKESDENNQYVFEHSLNIQDYFFQIIINRNIVANSKALKMPNKLLFELGSYDVNFKWKPQHARAAVSVYILYQKSRY